MKFHHPGKRVVHIKYTIYTFDFEWIETIEECVFLGCNINSMDIIKPSGLGTEFIFRKCIFYDCTIDSMEIQGVKIKERSEIYFINCRIKNLELNDIYVPGLYFMDCDINDSTFKYSKLPALTFSKFKEETIKDIINKVITGDGEKAIEAKNEILDYSCKSTRKSEIRSSKFLFCELNDLSISGTNLFETDIKHSLLEDTEITDNVSMKDISLWGTKISEGKFIKCSFKDIWVKKGVFLPQLVGFICEIIAIIGFFLCDLIERFFKKKNRKKSFNRIFQDVLENINIWRKVINFKKPIKKLFYKIPFAAFLADWLSSTDVRETDFDGADFSEDPSLEHQIDEYKLIHKMKKKHPFLTYFFFLTSNYKRSFMRFIFVCFCCICIFSWIYSCSTFIDDNQINRELGHKYDYIDEFGHPKHPFGLSFEVYLGITTYPLKAKYKTTTSWIIFERILGYGALASLLGILLAPLALEHYKKKKEDDAEPSPGRDEKGGNRDTL